MRPAFTVLEDLLLDPFGSELEQHKPRAYRTDSVPSDALVCFYPVRSLIHKSINPLIHAVAPLRSLRVLS